MSKKEKAELLKELTEKVEKLNTKQNKYAKRFLKRGLTEEEIESIFKKNLLLTFPIATEEETEEES